MKFITGDAALTIRLEGMEQVWALRRSLQIKREQVWNMQWYSHLLMPKRELGWRIGGTGVPGLLYAGLFTGSKGKSFVYLKRPRRLGDGIKLSGLLMIELRHPLYKRILLSVADQAAANEAREWWLGRP